MIVSLGLFLYGIFTLFSLSALLATRRFPVSRRAVWTRGLLFAALLSGTTGLAWRDYAQQLTAGLAWGSALAALVAVGCATWAERFPLTRIRNPK